MLFSPKGDLRLPQKVILGRCHLTLVLVKPDFFPQLFASFRWELSYSI